MDNFAAKKRKFAIEKSEPLVRILKDEAGFKLSWTHYLILMRIQDENERNFYEIEAQKQGWSKQYSVLKSVPVIVRNV